MPTGLLETLARLQLGNARVGLASKLWPWSRTTAWRRVREVMRAAEVGGAAATPKGLRHAFGIVAVAAAVPYLHGVRLHEALDAKGMPNQLCTVAGGKRGGFTLEEELKIGREVEAFLRKHGVLQSPPVRRSLNAYSSSSSRLAARLRSRRQSAGASFESVSE